MEEAKQLTLRIEHIIFTTMLSISKILSQTCEKSTKSIRKTLIFTTLDTLQSKNLMVMKRFTILIHCI